MSHVCTTNTTAVSSLCLRKTMILLHSNAHTGRLLQGATDHTRHNCLSSGTDNEDAFSSGGSEQQTGISPAQRWAVDGQQTAESPPLVCKSFNGILNTLHGRRGHRPLQHHTDCCSHLQQPEVAVSRSGLGVKHLLWGMQRAPPPCCSP